jgi:thiamine transporter
VRSERVRMLAEVALTVALCAVLKLWRIQLPWNFAGGDISLAMLPILVLALRRGVVPAAIAGAAFGVVDFFFEPYAAAPIQVLLDYPVAFALLGVAGFGSRQYRAFASSGRRLAAETVAVPWMVLGAASRFAAHFVSGIVFFGSNAPPGTPVWAYSALYNLSYVVPSLLLSIVAALLVLPVLEAAVPVGSRGMNQVSS